MSAPSTQDAGTSTTPDPRRWWALAVIAGAQLVLMLDAVIVNIALPSAQAELHLSDGDRQWVITAYTLTFGGLLLLGGRLGDLFGRKRTFVVGLLGFAAASALGGAATSAPMLLFGRVLQGAFASILAPTVLSLIVLTFTDTRERGKAFGMYGIIGAAGGSVGLVLGGLITQFLDWRWTMYINVPVAIVAAIAGSRILTHTTKTEARLDIPGTILGTTAIASLVFAFGRAASQGWGSAQIIGFLVLSGVALLAFVGWQTRARQPLVPLRLFANRTRTGALLTILLMVSGNYGMFLFTTYYMQGVLKFTPLTTGLAYVPMTGVMVLVSTVVVGRISERIPVTRLIASGLVIAIAGMVLLTRIDAHGTYASELLAPLVLLGAGMGLVFGKIMGLTTLGARPEDTGSASALTNVAQQVGGSVGPALLNTIAISASTAYVATHGVGDPAAAATYGFTTGFAWSVGLLTLAFLAVVLLIRVPSTSKPAKAQPVELATVG